MNQKTIYSALAVAAASVIAGATAQAQNTTYAPGDIVLFFQQFGGSNTVMVNVGAATTFRDTAVNLINIANINAELSSGSLGFGATWYDTSTLFWGAAGVFNNSTSTTTVTNGDPGRTLYASRKRAALGTEGAAQSSVWAVDSNGSMTTGANGIIQMANRMETISLTTTLVEGVASSNIDGQNLFNITGNPTISFGVLPSGGVQGNFDAGSFGTFGGVSAEAALDLYRILAVSPVGTVIDPGNVNRTGNYQGSFVIDQAGDVSFIVNNVPEPSSVMLLGMASLIGGCIRRRKSVA